MLVQDTFVVSTMSGERPLQRSSWKAEAIRKGSLKISGPIPITEETPLTEEEERQYAERHNSIPLTASLPPASPLPQNVPVAHGEPLPASDHPVAHLPPPQEEQHQVPHKASLDEVRETSELQRTEPASRNAQSPFPSIPESPSKIPAKKQKRKSGIRSAFRKMFGRKRDESREGDETSRRGHSYHVSDPIPLSKSPEAVKEPAGGQRISDLPVRELVPLNPLAQHLPFPMNVNAPQESSPPHEYLTFEVPPSDLGRRRATLPGILHANAETQSLSGDTQLASLEERMDGEISPQIGIALSSPTQAHSIRSKRRSRSAGALRDLAKGRTSTERRRSAEIRYWRQSYQSGSVYSNHTPRPRTAQTVDTVRTVGTQDYIAQAPESVADSSTVHVPTVDQHDQDLSEIHLPVEAFNFGNLKSGFDDDDEEPEAPPPEPVQSENRLSMEERVQHLEDNMRIMETSVNRMSGRSNRQTIILENAPKGRRSRNRSSSATSDRQSSHHSSRSSNVTLGASGRHSPSGPPSPVLAPLSSVSEFPQRTPPPSVSAELSATPPRPPTSYRSELATQFTAIYEALKHERKARKTLEKQVVALQREISDLHNIVNKLHTRSPSYPTPSPEVVIASSEERLSTPRATRQDMHIGDVGVRETVLRQFNDGGRAERDGSEWSSKEDVTSPEDWATPKEESAGFFGKSRSKLDLKGEAGMF